MCWGVGVISVDTPLPYGHHANRENQCSFAVLAAVRQNEGIWTCFGGPEFRNFSKMSDRAAPRPLMTWVLADEHPESRTIDSFA